MQASFIYNYKKIIPVIKIAMAMGYAYLKQTYHANARNLKN